MNNGVPENLKKGQEKEAQQKLESNFNKLFEMLTSIQDRLAAIEAKQ